MHLGLNFVFLRLLVLWQNEWQLVCQKSLLQILKYQFLHFNRHDCRTSSSDFIRRKERRQHFHRRRWKKRHHMLYAKIQSIFKKQDAPSEGHWTFEIEQETEVHLFLSKEGLIDHEENKNWSSVATWRSSSLWDFVLP